jgi:ketosteroid isomerase-like protein
MGARQANRSTGEADAEAPASRRGEAVMRRLVAAFNDGDTPRALDDLDPEVAFQDHPEMPDATWNRGLQGGVAWAAKWRESIAELHLDVADFREQGDRFFYAWTATGRGRASGADVMMQGYGVGTLRDGRLLRLELYTDRDEALRSIGWA